jgi:hypothetical protein
MIPHALLDICRAYALKIVIGSGRSHENTDWVRRIEEEFSVDPVTRKAVKTLYD